jgi:hypothetical protein
MSDYSSHPFDVEVYWDAMPSAPGLVRTLTADEARWLFGADEDEDGGAE